MRVGRKLRRNENAAAEGGGIAAEEIAAGDPDVDGAHSKCHRACRTTVIPMVSSAGAVGPSRPLPVTEAAAGGERAWQSRGKAAGGGAGVDGEDKIGEVRGCSPAGRRRRTRRNAVAERRRTAAGGGRARRRN
jgi:hypothetical protein